LKEKKEGGEGSNLGKGKGLNFFKEDLFNPKQRREKELEKPD